MTGEFVGIMLGFLTLAGGQLGLALLLVRRMDRHAAWIRDRFDAVDGRFERQTEQMNQRFERQTEQMNQRFERQTEQMNQRFERQTEQMNQRFDAVHARFDGLGRDIADLRERVARVEVVLESSGGSRGRSVA